MPNHTPINLSDKRKFRVKGTTLAQSCNDARLCCTVIESTRVQRTDGGVVGDIFWPNDHLTLSLFRTHTKLRVEIVPCADPGLAPYKRELKGMARDSSDDCKPYIKNLPTS
jgi:hypothetical protein